MAGDESVEKWEVEGRKRGKQVVSVTAQKREGETRIPKN